MKRNDDNYCIKKITNNKQFCNKIWLLSIARVANTNWLDEGGRSSVGGHAELYRSLSNPHSTCLVLLVFLSLPSSFPRAQLQRSCSAVACNTRRQVAELRPPSTTSFVLEAKIQVVANSFCNCDTLCCCAISRSLAQQRSCVYVQYSSVHTYVYMYVCAYILSVINQHIFQGALWKHLKLKL